MKTFKMTYIKRGEYDSKEDTIEAKDRWDAIREFRKKNGIRRISDLDYFHDEEIDNPLSSIDKGVKEYLERGGQPEEAIKVIKNMKGKYGTAADVGINYAIGKLMAAERWIEKN